MMRFSSFQPILICFMLFLGTGLGRAADTPTTVKTLESADAAWLVVEGPVLQKGAFEQCPSLEELDLATTSFAAKSASLMKAQYPATISVTNAAHYVSSYRVPLEQAQSLGEGLQKATASMCSHVSVVYALLNQTQAITRLAAQVAQNRMTAEVRSIRVTVYPKTCELREKCAPEVLVIAILGSK